MEVMKETDGKKKKKNVTGFYSELYRWEQRSYEHQYQFLSSKEKHVVGASLKRHPFNGEIRMAILGPGLGKSCLALRFLDAGYAETFDPTVLDMYRKSVQLDENNYVLDIQDLGMASLDTALLDSVIENADVFLVCYSRVNSNINDTLPIIERIRGVKNFPSYPITIVALADDDPHHSYAQDVVIAHQLWCSHTTTSSKKSHNVKEAFTESVWVYLRFFTADEIGMHNLLDTKTTCCVM
eukprot:TRINITY_DN8070_c0_g1_i2.p1 TRINITY_DN8070_c0_g1~~TRINITY_DN8070_c0_g1_i2.p1  ORF type:complete len:239 (+),score=32.28 TRINITY_DN8070_c0_g1_i2:254-970(+)